MCLAGWTPNRAQANCKEEEEPLGGAWFGREWRRAWRGGAITIIISITFYSNVLSVESHNGPRNIDTNHGLGSLPSFGNPPMGTPIGLHGLH